MTFERYKKYLVVKTADIEEHLTSTEQLQLATLTAKVIEERRRAGKADNSYVVVNEDQPYATLVWGLIELWETMKGRRLT
ncbi:hypothetical protein LCGC14_0513840 [marine sediment metagenome]|uniref:Uncharacterized protein n=1 Tax=marine sediment metagenome TaxID=412755 RepID=A0A0F9SIW3_9ZZZZ